MSVPQNTEQSLCDISAPDLTQSSHFVMLVPQNTEQSQCDVSAPDLPQNTEQTLCGVSAPEHRAFTV